MSALYIFAAFGFVCYLNSGVLKSIYAEPRPFWVSSEIRPERCRRDFGNPSGHAMTASFFWITLYLHQYYEVGSKMRFRGVFCTAYIVKMALTAVLFIYLIFLGLSRVFLGEHSYNQVVHGTLIGSYLAVVLHYFVKPVVKQFPNSVSLRP